MAHDRIDVTPMTTFEVAEEYDSGMNTELRDFPAKTGRSASSALAGLGRAPLWDIFRTWPGLLIVPLVLFVAVALGDLATQGPILCVFRRTLGIPCAGCGMTRGFVALSHGHWSEAVAYNPLTPIAYLWMVVWWLVAVITLFVGRTVPKHPDWMIKLALVVLCARWLYVAVTFVAAPHAWLEMVAVAPLMYLIDGLIGNG
jgi:hypothetical protein